MTGDRELLMAWKVGDKRAGRELCERHYDAVQYFLRSKVGDDAADLAQKTFLGCLEGADRFEGSGSFRSWLFSIAYRQLCKHYRARASEDQHLDFATVTAHDLAPGPSAIIARSDEDRLLLLALRQIPLEMQVALELHYWEEMSDVAIARTLGAPLGTIKSRIRRARQALSEQLEQLSSSPDQLHATLDNLERWAERLRAAAHGGETP